MAVNTPGGYGYPGAVPPPPVPAKKSNSQGCIIAALAGCGVLVLATIVLTYVGVNSIRKNPEIMKQMSSASSGFTAATTCGESMPEVRTALRQYLRDHDDKYPNSLDELRPKYLNNNSAQGCGGLEGLQYYKPKPDAPPDTIVVDFYAGEISVIRTQRQLLYVRLLKNGDIVMDQSARTLIRSANRNRSERSR